MRKCRRGWHLDDGDGYKGICSYCCLNLNHPTFRRIKNAIHSARLERRDRKMSDLLEQNRRVPMRSESVTYERLRADYKQATSLLRDDLVWSADFEAIRIDLLVLLEDWIDIGVLSAPEPLDRIVQTLISTENDLTI